MSAEWPLRALGELTINHDARRQPVKESDRRAGPYPYYGASGVVDHVDGYIFDGEYLLIGEDGENLRTRHTPVAFMARGKFWVNNHAHIVTGNDAANTKYLLYALLGSDISSHLTGAVMPKLTQGNLNRILVPCPPRAVQEAVVSVLGSFDDRIGLLRETNATLEGLVKKIAGYHQFHAVRAGSASDRALLRPHIYSAQVKKRLEKRFKNPGDPLRMVIVRDMWLTGFDAPCVHTLYIDKPMKGHNLMQAIARVNRVFKDKQGGLVVDYIGIANELKSALKEYTASKGRGRPTVDAHEAYSVLAEKLDALRGMLHGFDYSGFMTGGHKTLAGAANFVLGIADGKKRFADTALAMSKAFTLCCTLDEAKAVREEVAFFQGVKVILTKRDISQQKKTDEARELAIRQIIDSAVVSEDVVDIFDAVGLDKPNIGILDDTFLAEVRNLPERNLAVELLERLLEGEIKSRFGSNVVQHKKFSDMLGDVVQRYQNRSIEAAQVMDELVQMARKFREAASRGEQLGLNDDEVRFYDALANNESAVRELSDETLKKIAQELAENLRKNLTVDWSARESVQAKLRLMVKRILRKYRYPPDEQESAVELVLQQAKALGEQWA